MDVHQRIAYAREQRHILKTEAAAWLDLSPASYGRKEKGAEGGLGPARLGILINRLNVDARFIFGQMDSWEEADLLNPNRTTVPATVAEYVESRIQLTGDRSLDKLVERLRVDAKLRAHIEKIATKPGDFIEKVDSYARFLMAENDDSERARDAG